MLILATKQTKAEPNEDGIIPKQSATLPSPMFPNKTSREVIRTA